MLPVSAAVVQRHRGVLEIRERDGRSAFVIELPAMAESAPKPQRIACSSSARYPTLVIVETRTFNGQTARGEAR